MAFRKLPTNRNLYRFYDLECLFSVQGQSTLFELNYRKKKKFKIYKVNVYNVYICMRISDIATRKLFTSLCIITFSSRGFSTTAEFLQFL